MFRTKPPAERKVQTPERLDLLEYELLPNGEAIGVTIPGFYLGYGKAVPSGDVE